MMFHFRAVINQVQFYLHSANSRQNLSHDTLHVEPFIRHKPRSRPQLQVDGHLPWPVIQRRVDKSRQTLVFIVPIVWIYSFSWHPCNKDVLHCIACVPHDYTKWRNCAIISCNELLASISWDAGKAAKNRKIRWELKKKHSSMCLWWSFCAIGFQHKTAGFTDAQSKITPQQK